MARFSSTEKWGDGWFTELSPIGKLTFLYLVDKCDNAGFYEINKKIDPIILGVTIEQYFEALEEISKSYIKSKDGKKIWLKNYLRHQKNLPVNPNNNAHKQIISILQANISFFDYDFSYLGGANKPLIRDLGNVIGNVIGKEEGNTEKKENKYPVPKSMFNEGTVIGEMMKVWMQYNPSYQSDVDNDSHALLDIAHRIAKLKKIEKKELFNGQLKTCVDSWETIVKFIRRDDFFKKLELTTIEKKWTGLFQTMEAAKEGSFKDKAADPTKVKISV